MRDPALLDYLVEFHSKRNYFECHEVLERRWMQDTQRDVRWKSLLQLAVGCYHHRRGNFSGASKVYNRALTHLAANLAAITELGFLATALVELTIQLQIDATNQVPYQSVQLPMDTQLLSDYQAYCEAQGIKALVMDTITDPALIDAHLPQYRND